MGMPGQQLCVFHGERFDFDRESFQFASLGIRQFALIAAGHEVIEPVRVFASRR